MKLSSQLFTGGLCLMSSTSGFQPLSSNRPATRLHGYLDDLSTELNAPDPNPNPEEESRESTKAEKSEVDRYGVSDWSKFVDFDVRLSSFVAKCCYSISPILELPCSMMSLTFIFSLPSCRACFWYLLISGLINHTGVRWWRWAGKLKVVAFVSRLHLVFFAHFCWCN
jgi:hypothetical protein